MYEILRMLCLLKNLDDVCLMLDLQLKWKIKQILNSKIKQLFAKNKFRKRYI